MVGGAESRPLPSIPAMVVLRASTAPSSSVIWLLHWLLALVLSAARLVLTLSRAAWIPALPAAGWSSWSSSATDAFGAAASAQARDAATVVPLAAVVVVVERDRRCRHRSLRRRRRRNRPWRGAGAWPGWGTHAVLQRLVGW